MAKLSATALADARAFAIWSIVPDSNRRLLVERQRSLGTGREDNRLLYLTADIIIPLSYSLLLWSAISRGALYRFRGLAFLGGAFDYLENIVVLILLSRYPEHLDNLVTLAACFTLLKFLSCGLAIVLAVTGFLIKVFRQSTATAFS